MVRLAVKCIAFYALFGSSLALRTPKKSSIISVAHTPLHQTRQIADAPYANDLVNHEDHIKSINDGTYGWEAASQPRFEGQTLLDVSILCGTVMKGEDNYFELPAKEFIDDGVTAPASFDARENWPKCPVIGTIRDQSSCGSCWAFGSTEAFEDRMCISTGKSILFSPEDTVGCCGLFDCMSMGCNGGQPSAAWNWFKRTGVVTGGLYTDIGKGDTCEPYTLPPCAHHVNSTKYKPCPSSEYKTPKCTKKCSEAKYPIAYPKDKHKAKSSYSVNGVANIEKEISTNGPVTGAFTVYSDFPNYKSGVYTKTPGASYLGGHAIKLMGYGTEGGVDYWLVANSWNDQWGMGGTFKIKKGTNECGIEGQISAGLV